MAIVNFVREYSLYTNRTGENRELRIPFCATAARNTFPKKLSIGEREKEKKEKKSRKCKQFSVIAVDAEATVWQQLSAHNCVSQLQYHLSYLRPARVDYLHLSSSHFFSGFLRHTPTIGSYPNRV